MSGKVFTLPLLLTTWLVTFGSIHSAYSFNHTSQITEQPESPVTSLPGLPVTTGPALPACYPNEATQIYDSAVGHCIPTPNGFEHCPNELVYNSISGRCESIGLQSENKQNPEPHEEEREKQREEPNSEN